MTIDLLVQIAGYLIGGVVAYAAMKSDLARAIVLAEQAGEAAKEAHQRIDLILNKGQP